MSEAVIEQPGLSQGERVIDTFVAPSKTFQDIFRSRSWWLPFLISVILTYGFFFAASRKVGVEQMVQHSMEQRAASTGQTISPEQQAKGMAFGVMLTKIIFALSPVMSLIFSLLFALFLWLGFNFILGGTAEFTRLFTMTIYTGLIGTIKLLIAILTIWFGTNDNFDINNPAGTNVGYFLGPDAPKWLVSLGTSLDITVIWSVVLLGLGGAILAKVKPRTGIMLTVGVWIVIVAIKTVIAAL